MQFGQLLRREGRTEIGVPFSHQRHREVVDLSRQPVVARPATMLRRQTGGAVLFKATQQAKHLATTKTDQLTGIDDPKTTRLNLAQLAGRLIFGQHNERFQNQACD
jgi:hypothetical protein